MDNRDIRRHSLKNFVYVGDEMEVDSSVLLGMAYRYRHRMKKVPRAIRKQGREAYTQYEDHPISCACDLGRVAFADEFLYYVYKNTSVFSSRGNSKTETNVSLSCIDPNSADGCNIDLSDITVDIDAIPQPSKNYIFSRRCRELALRIFLPLLMMFALPMMNSCKDEPDNPTPPTPQPDPTDTIVIPTKEKVFDWDWRADDGWIPSVDSIKKYVDDPTYKYVFVNLINKGAPLIDGPEGEDGSPCGGYRNCAFRRARDSVYSVADKCNGKFRLSGTVLVSRNGGAQLPEDVDPEMPGMRLQDSIDLAKLGLTIKRQYGVFVGK